MMLKATLLSLAIFCLAKSAFSLRKSLRMQYASDFDAFINQFERNYEDDNERNQRFEIFVANMERAKEYQKTNPDAKYGMTGFSDRSADEISQLLMKNFKRSTDGVETCEFELGSEEIPESFDWKDSGVVTSVKNQNPWGACWAFAGVALLEARYAMKGQTGLDLSEQELIECDGVDDGAPDKLKACDGGTSTETGPMKYIQENGITDEAHYPWACSNPNHTNIQNLSNSCPLSKQNPDFPSYTISSYCTLKSNNSNLVDEETLKQFLHKIGPVAIVVNTDSVKWTLNNGGIMKEDDCGSNPVHEVLLTGYGTENGVPYWRIKNSWGTSVGDEGFMRIYRGNNTCGITQDVTSITL